MKSLTDTKAILQSSMYNRCCYHSEVVPILEKCADDLGKIFLESIEGDRVFIDDIIEEIRRCASLRGLEYDPRIVCLIDRLEDYHFNLRNQKKGTKGERFAAGKLKRLSVKNFRLENVQLNYDNNDTEIDQIVITEKGIFLIEVKYCDQDMCITKEGHFLQMNRRFVTLDTINILEKMSDKKYILRSLIAEALNIDDIQRISKQIHPVIFFANNRANCDYKQSGANLVYCHNAVSFIENYQTDVKLSSLEMEAYQKAIESCAVKKEYDVGFDLDSLRESVIQVVELFEQSAQVSLTEEEISIPETKEESPSLKWKFDWKSAAIGSLITGGGFGIGYVTYKYLPKLKVKLSL